MWEVRVSKKLSVLMCLSAFDHTKMVVVSPSELKALEDCLLNTSGKVPLHNRFRALFTLKGLKSEESVRIIGKGTEVREQINIAVN